MIFVRIPSTLFLEYCSFKVKVQKYWEPICLNPPMSQIHHTKKSLAL